MLMFDAGLHFTYPLDRRRALAEDPANSKSSALEMMSPPGHDSLDGAQLVRLSKREGDKGVNISSNGGATARRGSAKGDEPGEGPGGPASWHDSFE